MIDRMEKINELVRQQLSLMIHDEFAATFGIISVNYVQVERDLKTAKVYVSAMNQDSSKVIRSLQNKAYLFQNKLGKYMTTRNIPKLEFILDISQEKVDKVEELLSKIKEEK